MATRERRDCPDCDGPPRFSYTPENKCSNCDGTGKIFLPFPELLPGPDHVKCKICDGTGQCQTCGGAGYQYVDVEEQLGNDDSERYSYGGDNNSGNGGSTGSGILGVLLFLIIAGAIIDTCNCGPGAKRLRSSPDKIEYSPQSFPSSNGEGNDSYVPPSVENTIEQPEALTEDEKGVETHAEELGTHWQQCNACAGSGQENLATNEVCGSCAGKGQVNCYNCGAQRCANCNGSGKFGCAVCSSTGSHPCANCRQTGYVSYAQYRAVCENCKGKGSFVCDNCKGRASFTCDNCKGKGTISNSENGVATCGNCSGSGQVETETSRNCSKCNGKGQIEEKN